MTEKNTLMIDHNKNEQQLAIPKAAIHSLSITWARHQDEVEEAQRLRYKVFAEEMGA